MSNVIGIYQSRSEVDEEIRLQNSAKLMYGNKDSEKLFPFDVRARFQYVIYHEVIGQTEDGQPFSKVSTRRYSFFHPSRWDELMSSNWFGRNKRVFKILHDPISQAELENVTIEGYYSAKTGLSLAQKLASVVSAEEVANDTTVEKPKRGRKSTKEVTNG
jgi:hypothetical protein